MKWFFGLLAVAVTLPSQLRFRADGASLGNDRAMAAKLGDIISVKDPHGSSPGAVGDGVTDDSAAVQACETAAQAASKTCYFPDGTYLTDPFTISGSNVAIVCASPKTTTIKQRTASSTGLINLTSGPLSNIVIRNCKLDANSTTPTMNTYQSALAPVNPGINLGTYNTGTDTTGLIVENNDFTGFDQGLFVPYNAGGARLHQSVIRNNTFTGLSPSTQKDHVAIQINADTTLVEGNYVTGWTNGINPTNFANTNRVIGNHILMPASGNDVGIYASSAASTIIANNYIELNATSNAASDGCIKVGAPSNPISSFAVVQGNVCIRGTIKVSNASDSSIIGNTINSTLNIGCGQAICVTAETANPRMIIANNIITSPVGNGIETRATDSFSITGNVIDAPGGLGIRIFTGATNGWVISGNRVRESAGGSCIYVDGSTYGSVTGNTCYHSATLNTPAIRVGGSSSYVTVTGNTTFGYRTGVQIDTGTNTSNTVMGNTFAGTTLWGTFADGSSVAGMLAWNNVPGGTADTWNATNTPFSARAPVGLASVLQANLGTPANGTILYCSDCNTATACTAGGTGAFASRQNGAWKCL